ncbi:hypothetical protein [Cupriavidus sp. UYPR2.512]|uniref:hypothetical protein n=1 Tax=Cupriavidus sp. UYPR2.512 TaxID=1080187 RepID=UPI00036A4258|nr:hypothetical protein [Cupriavidus sp. UYPR2.512]UIF90933.1 hypothetical protein KAF44_32635 [Cupriavidus necator]
MFDRYHINESPSHVSVNVTERRAPTDESVRLLREMEQTAEKRITDSVRVKDQQFECVIHEMPDFINDRTRYGAVFMLNGVRMTAEYRGERMDTREQIAIGIRDAVATKIANAIAPAFNNLRLR